MVYVSGSFFKVAVGPNTSCNGEFSDGKKKWVFDTEPTIRQHFSVGHIAKKKEPEAIKREILLSFKDLSFSPLGR